MKSNELKKYMFKEKLFCFEVYFCLDRQVYKNIINHFNWEFDVDSLDGVNFIDENSHRIYIGIFDKKLTTLVHESTHAGLRIMERIGQDLKYKDEVLPYLIEYIFNNCEKKWQTLAKS